MKLGLYFEYLCIGSLNRDGTVPEMVLTSTNKTNAGTKHLIEQVKNFQKIVNKHKITWQKEDINKLWVVDKGRYRIEGHPDLPAEMNKIPVIIDLKSTGLIDDKWKPYGWHKSKVIYRKDLKLQTEMYQLLTLLNYNIDKYGYHVRVFYL